jgi:hypothetical protein
LNSEVGGVGVAHLCSLLLWCALFCLFFVLCFVCLLVFVPCPVAIVSVLTIPDDGTIGFLYRLFTNYEP